jgi:hypothetical protein
MHLLAVSLSPTLTKSLNQSLNYLLPHPFAPSLVQTHLLRLIYYYSTLLLAHSLPLIHSHSFTRSLSSHSIELFSHVTYTFTLPHTTIFHYTLQVYANIGNQMSHSK